MLAAVVRWLCRVFPWLSYDYRHRRIRKVQFCPACMHKVRVTMRFVPGTGAVLVQCPDCLVCWGYNTAVKPELFSNLHKDPEVK